jgi:2-oxoglutarate dehydrogenase E1 component
LYKAIEHRESVRDGYLEHLLELEGITREEADWISEERHKQLQHEFDLARESKSPPEPQTRKGVWSEYSGGEEPQDDSNIGARRVSEGTKSETGVDAARLSELLVKLTETPEGFHLHRKLKKSVGQRREMAAGEAPLDWAAGEALAIATLATEGHRIRLAGQDTVRGTFSHRHAALFDVVDGHRYDVFQHLSEDQAPVEIINSPLCETAAMGFEYGYSLDFPEALVAWEAQFGDFVNAGQVIVDQFIASAEDKWHRLSGLVLLLPHGFEGQGPEHSSARLERFLTLAGDDNLQIVVPTTPAQYFHVLRRQVKRPWRKPLVVFTPKSILRHPRVVSSLDELADGRFRRVLPDDRDEPAGTSLVLLCSGKVYYDLLAAREERGRDDLAIVRVEQLYPLPERELRAALGDFAQDTPVRWVQEEPENMGAWTYWRRYYCERFLERFPFAGVTRAASASPATGSSAAHKHEQQDLIERAFEKGD